MDYTDYARNRELYLQDQYRAEDRARARAMVERERERIRQNDIVLSGLVLVAIYYFFKMIFWIIKWIFIGMWSILKALFAPRSKVKYKRLYQEEYEEYGQQSQTQEIQKWQKS